MDYEIQDQSEHGRFVIKMSGKFSMDKQNCMLNDLIGHPNWRKGLNQVADLRELEFGNHSINAIESVVLPSILLKEHFENSRHAIIISNQPEAMMKSAMFNFLSDKVGWISKIFTANEYNDALAWAKK